MNHSIDTGGALRAPAVAGLFYPADPAELRAEVAGRLERARQAATTGDPPKALVLPHAGHVFSGDLAAAGYALLDPARVRQVVLLGPAHRVPLAGLALPQATCFATPLGKVPLDIPLARRIAALPGVQRSDAAHAHEHSLEVHLPFLQVLLDDFSLLPLVVGDAAPEQVAAVLEAAWGGPETLIVASSDLSHFHDYRTAQNIDAGTIRAILDLAPRLRPEQACGACPVNGLLALARRKRLFPREIGRCNSGDTGGSRQRVVGYASIAFHEAGTP